MWCSGDEDGLQSQRSGVQSRQNNKKTGGSRDRVRVRGVNRVRDRDRVVAGGEHVIIFE